RSGEALQAIQEAAEIGRELAKGKPARSLPDLAMSLNNLSLRLSDAGRSGEALQAIQEAVGYYRPLAERIPARFVRYLASSLDNLARCHRDLGDGDSAQAALFTCGPGRKTRHRQGRG
ncbi:MAG: tetratricopeptide repeat protein, partial [Proteobacteria bacterium]|nr:tetratricopeptide repeat protein [Pseudomonadota bacterium]